MIWSVVRTNQMELIQSIMKKQQFQSIQTAADIKITKKIKSER